MQGLAPFFLLFFVLACIGAGLSVWALVAVAWFEGRDLIPFAPRRPVPWSGWEALAAVLVFVFLPGGAILLTRWILGDPFEDQMMLALLLNAVASLLTFIGLILWFTSQGARGSDLGMSVRAVDPLIGVAGFTALCLVMYPLNALLQQFGRLEHPVETVLAEGNDPAAMATMFFVAVLAAPLVEEFVFRVVLQGWLEKIWPPKGAEPTPAVAAADPASEIASESEGLSSPSGPESEPAASPPEAPPPPLRVASEDLHPYQSPAFFEPDPQTPTATNWAPIVASSAIFAALHAWAWPSPAPLFFLSLGLGYLYQRTHRLGPIVALHATLNGVSVAMLSLLPLLQQA